MATNFSTLRPLTSRTDDMNPIFGWHEKLGMKMRDNAAQRANEEHCHTLPSLGLRKMADMKCNDCHTVFVATFDPKEYKFNWKVNVELTLEEMLKELVAKRAAEEAAIATAGQ